ncbi:Myc-type, basic helix-loop-helix (bHLH) domain-containing protein [Cynara cardunculus var. scolymus]|uniref:Myc-type, basic helix-loop-helix (BHLH) domain-containing protein n=1 Tax=Cynara cardunculus var. scolymus TaxID=59895 RepID=A0A124SED1_CYNCS|nr:Myc-type, basic helix-loop-helix (bHLH) domain-containing protein [Cynara cardunculus var. scolymus]
MSCSHFIAYDILEREMALETRLFPQGQIGNFRYDYVLPEDHIFGGFLDGTNNINHHQDSPSAHAYWGNYSSSSPVMHIKDQWDPKSSPEDCTGGDGCDGVILGSSPGNMKVESPTATTPIATATAVGRRKRRRTKSGKNKEELENQRMTHITVERNRRKMMNEYLGVIRSLMPSSYAQRGDQASIVGGAINFVKELEQKLQTLEVQKRGNNGYPPQPPPQPFVDFFAFPQYSLRAAGDGGAGSGGSTKNRPPAMAEIEVTMVESHANLKILSKKRQRQLLKMVAGLQCLWLTILHLNLEDGCQLSTVDEIATAINCLLCRIEEESL